MMRGRSYLYRGSAGPFETKCYAGKAWEAGGGMGGRCYQRRSLAVYGPCFAMARAP